MWCLVGRSGGLAVRPIIRQHYVRFRKVKAVTGVDSQHGFFASDDYIVRIIGWPAKVGGIGYDCIA